MASITTPPDVSVIVPILNERGTLDELTERVIRACNAAGRTVELLLIDDGSTDGSWQAIDRLAARHDGVHGVRQRRTFGKAAALGAGFDRARGDVIVTMDGDLQDDPSELPRFFAALDGDLDAVSGWKKERHDPLSKRIPSKFFNLVLRNVSGLTLHDFNCGFKAYRREAAEALRPYVYGDMHRYLPAVLGAQGYRVGEIEVRHHARQYGESKYGVGRIFAGAFDLVTVLMLTKYRYRPLHAFGAAAAIVFALSLIVAGVSTAVGHSVGGVLALTLGVVIVMTLLGAGIVSELAVHSMGPAGTEPRISAVAEHDPGIPTTSLAAADGRAAAPNGSLSDGNSRAPTSGNDTLDEREQVERALEELAAGRAVHQAGRCRRWMSQPGADAPVAETAALTERNSA